MNDNRTMPDNHTPAQRHANMAAIHSASTKPELLLRKSLWRLGFRCHKACKNYTVPKTNTDFWTAKIARNQQRDQDTWRQLEAKGWAVIIVWECELNRSRLPETVTAVATQIHKNGETFRSAQDDRRKAREEYRQQRRMQKERESSLQAELLTRFQKQ